MDWGTTPPTPPLPFSLFLRLLFLAWGLHFYDLSGQVVLNGGARGVAPVDAQLRAVAAATPSSSSSARPGWFTWLSSWWRRCLKVKTVFWLRRDDAFIRAVPLVGVLCCLVGCVGYASRWMFLCCWLIYHSLDVCFFDGFQFPWENLLFEAGFLAIFAPALVPWTPGVVVAQTGPLDGLVLTAFRWLLFRLMFGFGKTKFLDDEDTNDGNVLYIYNFLFAQPMPNRLAQLATTYIPQWRWFWGGAVWFMWLVEIPLPFLALTPWRWVAAYGIAALQVGIFAGGCFGGFNLLTVILCVPLLVVVQPPPEEEEEAAADNTAGENGAPTPTPPLLLLWTVAQYTVFAVYLFVTLVCVAAFNSGNTQMWAYWSDLTRACTDLEAKPQNWWLGSMVRFVRRRRLQHLDR